MNFPSLIACHECDLLQRRALLRAGEVAHCRRCGADLYRNQPNSIDRALAYAVAALVLFLIANAYPIVGLEVSGNVQRASLYDTLHALWSEGREEVALLVGFTTMLTPAIQIVLMLYLLIPLRLNRMAQGTIPVLRFLSTVSPWSMMEVFLLGIFVALVKLEHLAHVETGTAMWAFAGLIPVLIAAGRAFNPDEIWEKVGRFS
ncbi:MAG TPA: paraquat-inducible protein A [Nitrospira sp.]